jgi:hypothetical protein
MNFSIEESLILTVVIIPRNAKNVVIPYSLVLLRKNQRYDKQNGNVAHNRINHASTHSLNAYLEDIVIASTTKTTARGKRKQF